MRTRSQLDMHAQSLRARRAGGQALDAAEEALRLRGSGLSVVETGVVLAEGLGMRLADVQELLVRLAAERRTPAFMMQQAVALDRDSSEALRRALSGDATALADLSSASHARLQEAERAIGRPLIVTRAAVLRILQGLLDGGFSSTAVQEWASLMRRGYVAHARESGPIKPLEIAYEAEWEDVIADAVSRLDEIGDVIDGEVSSEEVVDFIRLLGES